MCVFVCFLYVFPTLFGIKDTEGALVQIHPDPSASRNVQIWQRKRPDWWWKVPQLDVGSQVMEDPQSSPWVQRLTKSWLNDLEHFLGFPWQTWKPPFWYLMYTYDFPFVPIKIATVTVPSNNEYITPGTLPGTWRLPQKWQPNDMGLSENRVYSQWNSLFKNGIMIINHWL